jgi:polyisoprenoid-binding protein YceI
MLCVLAGTSFAQASVSKFDPEHTRFDFEMRTRWGQRVSGVFPRYDGELRVLPDGRRQVHIALAVVSLVVGNSERYTNMARGEHFFDAARFPLVEFVSDPHDPALANRGGPMRGRLSMHGVSRVETFNLVPSSCARPGKDCDVIAYGSVRRSDYGLDGWQFALVDRVRFMMRVRLRQEGP